MENLFEQCRTNTDQGNIGLGYAVAYFLTKGYTVLNPLTENQPYDLVVEKENKLFKIQVKTSSHKKGVNKDKWGIGLSTQGGNQSFSKTKHFDNTLIDYVFVLLSDGSMYLFNNDDLNIKTQLTIDPSIHFKNRIFLFEESTSFINQKETEIKYELKYKELKYEFDLLLKDMKENQYIRETGKEFLSDNKKNYFRSRRIVKRPSYDQLKKEIDDSSYVAVAKKYGVSDVTIKKWVIYYEKYGE